MASNKEYTLAIKIAGEVEKSLSAATGKTKKELRALAREAALAQLKVDTSFTGTMKTMGKGIDKVWDGSVKAVKTTAAAVTAASVAAAAAGAVVINTGSEFESAFAGVKKTVDGTDEQLNRLEANIRRMAKDKPQTAVELSEIAEAAGQLGIETDNIASFSNTVADLKEATNLGDEGASQMAQFANITKMSQKDFDRLGSTIVDLGNHMATTEQDIMSMGMRLAGAGTQIGMSQADIMGFSAALSSVGVEAEMGGSALSKTMINMQLAVEKGADPWKELQGIADQTGRSLADVINTVTVGGNGIKKLGEQVGMTSSELKQMKKSADDSQAELESYAEVAGKTAEEFAELFKSNPAQALSEFVAGIGNVERNGKSAIMVLDDMGITEVRQRDALLRAASASDLFQRSLDMANQAFEDNVALTNEAEQRYITFESRLSMVKNRVADVGISLYQGFREPLNEALAVGLDFTDDLQIFDPEAIERVSDFAKKEVPTLVRELKEGSGAVMDFVDPILSLGGWMLNHPDVISGGLAAIGTSIVTLKGMKTAASAIDGVKGILAVMAANPMTLAVAGVAAVTGAIAGLYTQSEMAAEKMKKADLASRFGDIALSVNELKTASKQIVGEKDLNRLANALDEIGKVTDIADDLKSASEVIDRLTWKVGMNLELTSTDKESLESSINSIIDNSLDMVEQAQYAAKVNVSAMFGNSEAGEEILTGFDSMYQGIRDQVEEEGRKLGEIYNKAMEDGIIDTDEAKLISEKTEQLRRLTDAVADYQQNAKLESIKLKYNGGDLTADSFQNLQSDIQNWVDEATSQNQESLAFQIANLDLQLDRSKEGLISKDDAAYLTDAAYAEAKAAIEKAAEEKQTSIDLNAFNFTMNTVEDKYPEVVSQIDRFNDLVGDYLEKSFRDNATEWRTDASDQYLKAIDDLKNSTGIDRATRDALEDIMKGIEPQIERWEKIASEYKIRGEQVPASIAEGLSKADAIRSILGNDDGLMGIIDNYLLSSPEALQILSDAEQLGEWIPEKAAEAIKAGADKPSREVEAMHAATQNAVQKAYSSGFDVTSEVRPKFKGEKAAAATQSIWAFTNAKLQGLFGPGFTTSSQVDLELQNSSMDAPINAAHDYAKKKLSSAFAGGFSASADLRLKVNPEISGLQKIENTMQLALAKNNLVSNTTVKGTSLTGHADGGIFTKPHVAWFAEAGHPEAAIPIDGSQNAVNLWQRVGQLLGVFGAKDANGRYSTGHADGGLMGVTGPPTGPGYANTYDANDIQDFDGLAFLAAKTASIYKAQQPMTTENGGILVNAAPAENSTGSASTYEVKKGDNLSKIAASYNTTAAAIYAANKDIIEKTAKKHDKSSSRSGHWIWPGEVLQIPDTNEQLAVDAALASQEGTGDSDVALADTAQTLDTTSDRVAGVSMDFKSILDSLLKVSAGTAGQTQGEAQSNITVTYSPAYQIGDGNAGSDAIMEAGRKAQDEFSKMLLELQRNQRRVSYSG